MCRTKSRSLRLVSRLVLASSLLVLTGLSQAHPVQAQTVSTATLAPLGPEFPAGDLPLPPSGWWKSCTTPDGGRRRILSVCKGDDCARVSNLLLARVEPPGGSAGVGGDEGSPDNPGEPPPEPVRINVSPAWLHSYRLSCNDTGWLVAQWKDRASGCFLHRVFDPDGNPTGEPRKTLSRPDDCRTRAALAVRDDGTFHAVWALSGPSGGQAVRGRAFSETGASLGNVVSVAPDNTPRRQRPKISLGEDGRMLVAWRQPFRAGGPAAIVALALDGQGTPVGEELVLNTFPYGDNDDPSIEAGVDGEFTVLWNNPLEGGRVARRVGPVSIARSVTSTSSTTTTTLLPASAPLELGAVRVIDRMPEHPGRVGLKLRAGTEGSWLLTVADGRFYRGSANGLSWTGPHSTTPSGATSLAFGTDAAGTWISLHVGPKRASLLSRRSLDDAVSFAEGSAVARIRVLDGECAECGIVRATVTGTPDGAWIAVWAFVDRKPSGEAVEQIYVSRSADGGVSWRAPERIANGEGVGAAGLEVATDGQGNWLVGWRDEELRVARSANDGRSWQRSIALTGLETCTSCNSLAQTAGLSIAADVDGNWLLAYAGQTAEPERYGHDGDIFVIRSSNFGLDWSPPLAVATHAVGDGSRDRNPVVVTDASGRWLLAWTSYHPLEGGGEENDGLEADVFVIKSVDRGVTWTPPSILAPRPADGFTYEHDPALAVSGDGTWMAVWTSSTPTTADTAGTSSFLSALGDTNCGDGVVDLGEECDDANTASGDGCDANCTVTGCGNGVVSAGEICDDGNANDDDGCRADCTAPVCGDGVVQPATEDCDDGNDSNTDDCVAGCVFARCGDGFLQAGVEGCDDGNRRRDDDCNPVCEPSTCGDGFVRPPLEACDDGNNDDRDQCGNDCGNAVCGDGYTSIGFEQCDPGQPGYAGTCTEDCKLLSVCGDANGDGQVLVSDGLQILRRTVDLPVDCPLGACDMDGNGTVQIGDAAMALMKSVGHTVGERCSLGTGWVVFWLDDERELAALQIDIYYGQTGGHFLKDENGKVLCENLLPDTFPAFNDLTDDSRLATAWISLTTFGGRVDAFRCLFELPEPWQGEGFIVHVVDASSPSQGSLDPYPSVGYRLE